MIEPSHIPVQPVEGPILCNPYDEPSDHWVYDRETGEASRAGHRRPAGYWYKTDRVGAGQRRLFLEEERDDLTLVNLLREDVRKWRDAKYRGASNVTKDLLRHWARPDLSRRLFFCQREAVETIIYLAELRMPGKSTRTGFKKFELSDADLRRLLYGERPSFAPETIDYIQTLIDQPFDESLLPLRRLGCKMATGSGKTVVMAMLIAWAFCNRGVNRQSREYPNGVLICCPNLTVKDRLQVLRPDQPNNYFEQFDIVPAKYRPLLQGGRVLITNWHRFALESEHKEGDKSYAVVNKGPETPDTFARRVLGDLYERMPIMVLNDEGHHCWRPAPSEEEVDRDERKALEEEKEEARVWLEGLDRLNNCMPDRQPGISYCVDLSATPFYLKGSGYPEGRPFPWLVNDFGLVDAIESGIVKIPRLPVQDTTGRPDPKYFKLWEAIRENLQPGEKLPGRSGKPKPEVVYREAEGALQQIAGLWVERFNYMQDATPGKENVPPALIVVCDNMDIAEVFYQRISGERQEEIVTEEDVAAASDEGEAKPSGRSKRRKKPKTRTVYGAGTVYPEFFSNTSSQRRTIRFDSKTLDEEEELRQIVSTIGKRGEPGEHIRCVVAVMMLNEGWDANNVTHILGIRAFKSQLLCEQVVGRGLRRMDYTPDPETGMLTAEYVDVYGIPFSVIPFKGRTSKSKTPEDKPKNHVRALPERSRMEIRFPVVEGYVFALERNLVRCNVDEMEPLVLEPNREPTATFVLPTVGYYEGHAAQRTAPWEFVEQNREEYYRQNHVQAIQFEIARIVVDQLGSHQATESGAKQRVMRLQSRHQLFPQVYGFVQDYVQRKVDFQSCDECELGLRKYVERIVERLRDGIEPDDAEGEPPLMPVLNRYKPLGTSAEVDFKTTQPCRATRKSHVNQVTADTRTWEQSAAFKLEQPRTVVECYVRNDHLGFVIPYEYQGVEHSYEPDFIVRLKSGVNVVLEIKGYEDEQTRAKHGAAKRWVSAVNHWGREGTWMFHVCRNPQTLERELSSLVGVRLS